MDAVLPSSQMIFLQSYLNDRMTEPSNEGPGFVGIRFCQECNNMLYPKEDKVMPIL